MAAGDAAGEPAHTLTDEEVDMAVQSSITSFYVEEEDALANSLSAIGGGKRATGSDDDDWAAPPLSTGGKTSRMVVTDRSVQPEAPLPPEEMVHNIYFWSNGFIVDDGPLRSFDNPEHALFLKTIRNSECPIELAPSDGRSKVNVSLIRKKGKCPVTEPFKRPAPFQGGVRTVASPMPHPVPMAATFRDHPRDIDLLDILRRCIQGDTEPWIHEASPYGADPFTLTPNYLPGTDEKGEPAWYFMCTPQKKKGNDTRISRIAGAGTWKGERKEALFAVKDGVNRRVGWCEAFSFIFKTRMPGEKDTVTRLGWIMHAISLNKGEDRDGRCICKVYPSSRNDKDTPPIHHLAVVAPAAVMDAAATTVGLPIATTAEASATSAATATVLEAATATVLEAATVPEAATATVEAATSTVSEAATATVPEAATATVPEAATATVPEVATSGTTVSAFATPPPAAAAAKATPPEAAAAKASPPAAAAAATKATAPEAAAATAPEAAAEKATAPEAAAAKATPPEAAAAAAKATPPESAAAAIPAPPPPAAAAPPPAEEESPPKKWITVQISASPTKPRHQPKRVYQMLGLPEQEQDQEAVGDVSSKRRRMLDWSGWLTIDP